MAATARQAILASCSGSTRTSPPRRSACTGVEVTSRSFVDSPRIATGCSSAASQPRPCSHGPVAGRWRSPCLLLAACVPRHRRHRRQPNVLARSTASARRSRAGRRRSDSRRAAADARDRREGTARRGSRGRLRIAGPRVSRLRVLRFRRARVCERPASRLRQQRVVSSARRRCTTDRPTRGSGRRRSPPRAGCSRAITPRRYISARSS